MGIDKLKKLEEELPSRITELESALQGKEEGKVRLDKKISDLEGEKSALELKMAERVREEELKLQAELERNKKLQEGNIASTSTLEDMQQKDRELNKQIETLEQEKADLKRQADDDAAQKEKADAKAAKDQAELESLRREKSDEILKLKKKITEKEDETGKLGAQLKELEGLPEEIKGL